MSGDKRTTGTDDTGIRLYSYQLVCVFNWPKNISMSQSGVPQAEIVLRC